MSGIPRGVGAPPPPGMDARSGKLMCIKVRMLDDSVAVFHLGHKATGQTLFDEVCRHLNLLESDYFGLEFIDCLGNHCWLDKEKPILRQISSTHSDAKFYLIVKFYTPNPVDLEEEYTRYLFTLQIKRDLACGDLLCVESTSALIAAYLVQSECGDFSPEDYPDASYLSHTRFVPNQTMEFQRRVMENHTKLVGMSPGESDLALLEVARRSDFYAIKFHPAKDVEGTEANLAVMHLGIKVFHQLHCVSTFSWAKIRKLSFKRKKLLIKLHPESYQYYKETIEFSFETRNECKSFWKKCVEHHAFFRCATVDMPKKDPKFFSKGSSFRYHGRTQKQLIDYVREHHKRREPFTRPLRSGFSASRHNFSSSASNVGGYSTVSVDRRPSRNGRAHVAGSLPHISSTPQPSTAAHNDDSGRALDARVRVRPLSSHQPSAHPPAVSSFHVSDTESRLCTSDVESGRVSHQQDASRAPASTLPLHRPGADALPKGDPSNESQQQSMSLSLPNVLTDDLQVVCREFEVSEFESGPPKSASGDNFLDMASGELRRKDYDNVSEDSYQLADHERETKTEGSGEPLYENSMAQSKTKRVVSAQHSKSTNTTDDECSEAASFPGRRRIKEFPFRASGSHMVPVEIDGPNVDLSMRRPHSDRPIYTSSGALLLKPKVISMEGDSSPSKVSPDSGHHSSIVSPPLPSTYGAVGPLPGKVITKENIMITPEGVKEKVKPAVPPKPKNLVLHRPPSSSVEPPSVPSHPVVHMVDDVPVQESPPQLPPPPPPHEAEPEKPKPTRPALISVQSEDEPEIQTCHLLNSEIPYTLTMRTVDSSDSVPFSTFRDGRKTESVPADAATLPKRFSPDPFLRRKSLDLVPRKRLPSPGNFSSMDHSISPTTPDSGDILEYLLRRRSMSQERSALAKRGKRGDPRRQTQPVRFDLPPSPGCGSGSIAGGSSPLIALLHDDIDDCILAESRSLHEDMERLERAQALGGSLTSFDSRRTRREESEESEALPAPPTSVQLTTDSSPALPTTPVPPPLPSSAPPTDSPAKKNSPPFIDDSPKDFDDNLSSSHRTKTGLLWTDF